MLNRNESIVLPNQLSSRLWSNSAQVRVEASKGVTLEQEKGYQEALIDDCPVAPWPYGITTSVNPIIATMGVSPGNSPSAGDVEFTTRVSQPLPKVGEPHPGTKYRDTAGYWDRLRFLARTILVSGEITETEAYSLFANLNLDTGASGVAERVQVDTDFASWILLNTRDRLQPRFLLCLGLSGYLQKNVPVRKLFETVFPGFQLSKPHNEFRFQGYARRNLWFREWDVVGPKNNEIKIVLWPQHPSRSPFTNASYWAGACEEFAERHGHLIR